MEITHTVIERLHIVTDQDRDKIGQARKFLDDNGYFTTTSGPIIRKLKATGKWEAIAEKPISVPKSATFPD